jgi:hypothetical protein
LLLNARIGPDVSERIYKLQPDRTLYLRGFDSFAAAASIHSASPGGFTVSGTFRDPADFAVAVLYDADNYFEHPSIKYLPDFNFSGLVLNFNLAYSDGVQPIDSPKYNWIDWATLDCILTDDTRPQIRLFDNAMLVGDSFPAASATINIVTSGAGIQPFDCVTLWYENLSWDFIAPNSLDPSTVAQQLANQINSTDWATAGPPYAILATSNGPQISVTAARYGAVNLDGAAVTLADGAVFSGILPGASILIGGTSYTVASIQSPTQLTLTSSAPQASGLPYIAPRGGRDGNMIQIYALSKTATLATDQSQYQFAGGSSAVAWNVTLDFTALKIDSLRQCWLTFAPSLAYGAAYTATEWQAIFSNWTLSGDEDVKKLQIAGPGSVRIEENDQACTYTGTWTLSDNTQGFYSRYFAMATADPSATVTINYVCQLPHDLYCGTSLYSDRAVMSVQVNGDAATLLDCTLDTNAALVTRRLMRKSVPAGRHTVTLSMRTPGAFYFDFLEAAVPTDVPDALAPRTGISPALDFDTDHSYKLSPARIHWIMDMLGYAGPMNEYLGVFWWNQRKLVGPTFPSAVISVGGIWAEHDVALLAVNGVTLHKDVLNTDTPATIAQHFAAYINESFVAAWASAGVSDSGVTLTITASSTAGAYALSVSTAVTSAAGTFTVSQQPVDPVAGNWVIDDTVTPPINRATRDWHADFYALAAARNREVVTSCSMELVNPPDGYAALFPDGQRTPVATATGFGSLVSNHCAIGNSKMLAYQTAVYRDIAGMQTAAGLTPALQYGEFLWWYFSFVQGLPVGYSSFTAPISIGTATAHGLATGDVVTISGVLGNSAANGVWTISVTDPTHFTLNGSSGNGSYTGGGSISGGGMAYYDDETMAAAQTALGRALNVFQTPNDNPTINNSADAIFLRNRLRDHVAALVADIRSAYPGVICEVLWPYDVNYPSPVGTPSVGGRLNRFINLPVEWQAQPQSGLDRMKAEALAFGTTLRDLNYAADAINLFISLGWPVNAVRYLVPIFGTAVPWYTELNLAIGAGLNTNNLWAFDHVCLYNLQVPEPPPPSRSVIQT